jgi:hypothetical protein
MAFAGNAAGRWQQLDGTRRGFITRCENFAAYTLPKICLPDNQNDNNRDVSQDFQAVGAQATNHLANKLMLALFAPSRPFFRLDPSKQLASQIAMAAADESVIADMLAQAEKAAIAVLDKRAIRPKLYEAVKHLIVTGNVLIDLSDHFRVIGIKKYCARRSLTGKLLELLIADCMVLDELDDDIRAQVQQYLGKNPDQQVTLYRWIKRMDDGDYHLTQWVDNYQLPKKFNGKWSEDQLPYRALTWDLADGQHYGTGLVEDYENDFGGLSALSRAQVQGAILASEFRWLVNPAGMTRPEDFEGTPNGGALPGNEGDVVLVQSGKSGDLQITMQMAGEYINRIGRGFLMGSTLIRDAERVTAEEIRLVANELETALGGAYSRIAVDFQMPLARWLLKDIDVPTGKETFEPTIVTGLDALSRGGDLDELKLWLADVAAVNQLPDAAIAELKLGSIYRALATPRRIKVDTFLKSEEEKAAEQAAMQQQLAEQQAAQAGIDVAANGAMVEQEQTL